MVRVGAKHWGLRKGRPGVSEARTLLFMKIFCWLYFTLLVTVQLIGWFGYGRPEAWTALMVIVVPSSILSGAAFFWLFYWNRPWTPLPIMLLVFIQIGVSASSRWAPGSALLCHGMAQFLERKVGSWESYVGGTVLLIAMFLLATAAAFVTAEGYRLYAGCRERGGVALMREAWHELGRFDNEVTGGKGDES